MVSVEDREAGSGADLSECVFVGVLSLLIKLIKLSQNCMIISLPSSTLAHRSFISVWEMAVFSLCCLKTEHVRGIDCLLQVGERQLHICSSSFVKKQIRLLI